MEILRNEFIESAEDAQKPCSRADSFEEFERRIKIIDATNQYASRLIDVGFADVTPIDTAVNELINDLERELDDEHAHWISFFIYNLDCGRRDVKVEDEEHARINLNSIAALWRWLHYERSERSRAGTRKKIYSEEDFQ